ncbi:hypothetical protein RI367_006916 [Sorochytrium milnesiophthora]
MSSDPSETGSERLQDLHVCRHCDYKDTTQSRIKGHYRQVHQHTARIKRGGVVVTVARGQDGMLRCVCGAGYTSQKYLKCKAEKDTRQLSADTHRTRMATTGDQDRRWKTTEDVGKVR